MLKLKNWLNRIFKSDKVTIEDFPLLASAFISSAAISTLYYFTPTGQLLIANEIGDWLAGFASALAFVWLIASFRQQSKQLKIQQQELNLQREELVAQRDEFSHMNRIAALENIPKIIDKAIRYLQPGGTIKTFPAPSDNQLVLNIFSKLEMLSSKIEVELDAHEGHDLNIDINYEKHKEFETLLETLGLYLTHYGLGVYLYETSTATKYNSTPTTNYIDYLTRVDVAALARAPYIGKMIGISNLLANKHDSYMDIFNATTLTKYIRDYATSDHPPPDFVHKLYSRVNRTGSVLPRAVHSFIEKHTIRSP